ncbi:MAG: hypothetical protein KatS3mg004_1345 [Bryobacteraceae bacterium]|nr:MAG: hypothetical protein KatS3mg004_1345 [Bryobacteraceae bacterium]
MFAVFWIAASGLLCHGLPRQEAQRAALLPIRLDARPVTEQY